MKFFSLLISFSLCLILLSRTLIAEELKFLEVNVDTVYKVMYPEGPFCNISINQEHEITTDGHYSIGNGKYDVVLANTTDLGHSWNVITKEVTMSENAVYRYNYFYDEQNNKHYLYIEGDFIYEIDFAGNKLIPNTQISQQNFIFQFCKDGFVYGRSKTGTNDYYANYYKINLTTNQIIDVTPDFSGIESKVNYELFSPWKDGLLFIYDLRNDKRTGKFLTSSDNGDHWNQMNVDDNIYDAVTKYDAGKIIKSDDYGMLYSTYYDESKQTTNLIEVYNNFQTIDTLLANDTTFFNLFTDFKYAKAVKFYSTKGIFGFTKDMGRTFDLYTTDIEVSYGDLLYNADNDILYSRNTNPDYPIIFSQIPTSVLDNDFTAKGESRKLMIQNYLSLSEDMLNKEIVIYNSVGEMIFNSPITSTQLDVSSLTQGLYSVFINYGNKMDKMLVYKE